MKEIRTKIIYTADNEEPDCGQCDHQCGNCWTDNHGNTHDNCVEHCGSEHDWKMYKRTE